MSKLKEYQDWIAAATRVVKLKGSSITHDEAKAFIEGGVADLHSGEMMRDLLLDDIRIAAFFLLNEHALKQRGVPIIYTAQDLKDLELVARHYGYTGDTL
jgi:hypothetical protein